MNDLYLKYQFTDRAGRQVYNIHIPVIVSVSPEQVEDKVTGYAPFHEVLGQIRLHPDKDDNVLLEWVEETQDED